MHRFIIILILLMLYSPTIYAIEIKFVNAIKKSDITVDDLSTFLDLNYYKYKILIEKGTDVFLVFRDIKNGKDIFRHNVEINTSGEYELRLWFKKYDDSIGDALTKNNKSINYSLNWNQERVFSGTITNPISYYENIYKVRNTYDYGREIGEKEVLLEFYNYDQKSDEEELVSEIYISTQRKE